MLETFEEKTSVILSVVLLVILGATWIFQRQYLKKNGGVIAGIGFFILLNLIYFSSETTKETQYDYVFCRHLQNLPISLVILFSFIYLALGAILIYNRFGSIVPRIMLFFTGTLVLLVLMGLSMIYAVKIHAFVAAIYALLLLYIFTFMYRKLAWVIWLLILGSFVLVSVTRDIYYKISDEKHNKGLDLAFSILTYSSYLILVFTPLIYSMESQVKYNNQFNEKLRRALLPCAIVVIIGLIIASIYFYL